MSDPQHDDEHESRPQPGQVVDQPERGRFALFADGHEAELTYRMAPGRITLVHTGVPEPLEGRGIAGRLVRAAVERAAAEGLTIAPWCPYARRWLERHPDAAATVTVDWSPPG
jgi:predicted GNAT family acetyltransferase